MMMFIVIILIYAKPWFCLQFYMAVELEVSDLMGGIFEVGVLREGIFILGQ
jgi:hypothetical protein